jgi:hypothetical protein
VNVPYRGGIASSASRSNGRLATNGFSLPICRKIVIRGYTGILDIGN